MKKTNPTVTIDLDIACAIAARMREALEITAEKAADKRTEAHTIRKQAEDFAVNSIGANRARDMFYRADLCDRRADYLDAEFTVLENICRELTRAGL